MREIVEKLSAHASRRPTRWHEAARQRRENREWLRHSRQIAMLMLDAMEALGLSQKALAERLGCSQQYVSRLLKGSENLSIETITKIEDALGIRIIRPCAS